MDTLKQKFEKLCQVIATGGMGTNKYKNNEVSVIENSMYERCLTLN